MKLFGYFEGMPYPDSHEKFGEYLVLKNSLQKKKVIDHIESLEQWLTSIKTFDIFTGERLQAGIYIDGPFSFPTDFLHYYKNYDIGIPYEYEEYLKKILK